MRVFYERSGAREGFRCAAETEAASRVIRLAREERGAAKDAHQVEVHAGSGARMAG